jgi:hypothetical protein
LSGGVGISLSKSADTGAMPNYRTVSSAGSVATDTPTPSVSDIYRERANAAKRSARDCIVLACVTSPGVSGELIDRAIGHYRNATSAIAAIAFIQAN